MIHLSRLWLGNVDDTFLITKDDKTETLDEFHTYSSKIHFSHESAVNKTLLFWTVYSRNRP